jgi:hypothetical protein
LSKLPDGAIVVTTVSLILYYESDGVRIGIDMQVDGNAGAVEVVGLLEMAKQQFIRDKEQG